MVIYFKNISHYYLFNIYLSTLNVKCYTYKVVYLSLGYFGEREVISSMDENTDLNDFFTLVLIISILQYQIQNM